MAHEKGVNRTVVYSEPPSTKTEVKEVPIPEPGPGEVLVQLQYSGVCHTDLAFCTNSFVGIPPTAAGQIGGHEGAGTISAHGPGVTSPPLGAPVGIKYSASACLSCPNCLQGGETTCSSPADAMISGYTCPGTFQQYVLAPANYVTPLPASLSDLAAAAPLMCSGVSVYTALKRAGVKQGDWVVVSGAGGGLGHLAVQYARVMGARVLGVDAGGKEGLVRELGAEAFVDFMGFPAGDDEALAARVKEITGGGAQIVLMCASSAKAYSSGLLWLGFRGRFCCLGLPEGSKEPALNTVVIAMVSLELTIMANKSGNRLEAIEAVEIAARHGIKTHYELKKMSELTTIFEDMDAGKINGRIVLDLR
ncbi:unnamed protein product [Discula destructiva]